MPAGRTQHGVPFQVPQLKVLSAFNDEVGCFYFAFFAKASRTMKPKARPPAIFQRVQRAALNRRGENSVYCCALVFSHFVAHR